VPNTFEDFKRICIKIGDPDKPKPKIDLKFITSRLLRLDDIYDKNLHRIPDLDFFNKKMEFDEQKVCLFPGGETKALELYQRRLEYEKENFKKGNQNPNLKKPMLFTEEISLSPYIRFGCLSPRKFYWDIKDSYDQNYTGNNDGFNPAEQLLWREYFYQMSFKNCNFHQIDDNPMSYKIPWDYSDEGNYFSKWEEAQTGFPWIDACMRQLKQEGWVHHIGRNSVAIFLTRGALYQSWHRGSKTFLHYLVDADWSVCAGNWNWISCGDPEDLLNAERTFCPVNYAKRCDPKGDFVRKYVKELSNYPLKYLFEPWKAPLHVQEEASCIIGQDYPEPMVDHESAYLENNFKLRQFFQIENSSHIRSIFRDNEVVRPSNSLEYKKFTYEDVLLKPEVDDDF
jgi:cryptochrome